MTYRHLQVDLGQSIQQMHGLTILELVYILQVLLK